MTDDFLSYATYQVIQTLINCGLNPILLLFGVTTNVISAVVFFRQGLRDRMNLCLFCLAIVDTLYLCSVFTLGSHCIVSRFHQRAGALVATYSRSYVAVLNEALMHNSAVITVIVSVERCVCVVLPLKAATIMSTRAMAALLAASSATVHLLCYLTFLKRDVEVGYDPDSGQLVTRVFLTKLYLDYPHVFDGVYVFVSIVLKIMTFVMVSLATTVTVFTLKRAIAWREATTTTTSTSTSSQTQQATRSQLALVQMLVAVSAVYIVCAVPSVTVVMVRSVVEEFEPWGPYPFTVLCCFMLAQVSTSLNSAVNMVVYVLRSSRFRAVLAQLLPCLGRLYPAAWAQGGGSAVPSSTAFTVVKEA